MSRLLFGTNRSERSLKGGIKELMAVSKAFFLGVWLVLFISSTAAESKSIPSKLIGHWCSETNAILFTSKGYSGAAESEEYLCNAINVRLLTEFGGFLWKVKFLCGGEFGEIQVNSLIRLRKIDGKRIMAVADTLSPKDQKKAIVTPLSIYSPCP